jgi:hypothetical protein
MDAAGCAKSPTLQQFVIPFARAGPAQHPSVPQNLAVEVDAFAAGGADYAVGFVSGEFFGGEFDFYPLLGE